MGRNNNGKVYCSKCKAYTSHNGEGNCIDCKRKRKRKKRRSEDSRKVAVSRQM